MVKVKTSVVISRNQKVNYKFLARIEEDKDGFINIPNGIHAVWDNGVAMVSADDTLFKLAKRAYKDEKTLRLVVAKLRKICKARKSEEFFFTALDDAKLTRHRHDSVESADDATKEHPSALGHYDRTINQVDKLCENKNIEIRSMIVVD